MSSSSCRVALLCLLLPAAAVAVAQEDVAPREQAPPAQAWAAHSGDAWIDLRLADINAYAARYPEAFADELVRYFDAPRELVADWIGERGAMPGDVYYACAIARVTGRPCRGVLEAWSRDSAEGWAPLVERMELVHGSPAAARLKQAFDASYARWSRLPPEAPTAAQRKRKSR